MQITVTTPTDHQQHTVTIPKIATHVTAHLVIHACAWCGREFLPLTKPQRFCSTPCRQAAAYRDRARAPK